MVRGARCGAALGAGGSCMASCTVQTCDAQTSKNCIIAILGVLSQKQVEDRVLFGLTNLIWGNRGKGNRGAGVGRV